MLQPNDDLQARNCASAPFDVASQSYLALALAAVGGGWSATPSASGDLIDLTVADPDLPTPAAVVERAIAALRAGDTRYPDASGRPKLRCALAQRHERGSAKPAGPENVLVTPGAQCALYLAARCLAGPGDHLAVVEPYYLNYPATLAASGAEVGFIRTDPDADFAVTEEAIASALRPNTKAIVLSHPNNPTSRCLRRRELAALANAALARDLWLVSDEIYGDLCYEDAFVSLSSVCPTRDRLVVLGSLSKSHAMTGWRVGWMIAPAALIEQAGRLADLVYHRVPGFIQEAALAAIEDRATPRWAAETYRRRRDVFAASFEASSPIAVRQPQAGPFVFCDIRRTGLSGREFAEIAAREGGVGVVDGRRFGESGGGFVRAALTRPEEVLIEAGRRLNEVSLRLCGKAARAAPDAASPGVAESTGELADGVYVAPSGTVYVCRDGAMDGLF